MKYDKEKMTLKVPKEIRQKVLNAVDSENVINLCSKLVQFNSVVENEAAEKEIADYVANYFKKLSLEVKIVGIPEDPPIPGMSTGPHPQVIARLKGPDGKPVFLVEGHLDTEPVVNPEKWTHGPFSGDVIAKRATFMAPEQ